MHDVLALAVADVRASLAHLADHATSVDAASAYERVLLTLDAYTADSSPSASEDAVFEGRCAALSAARRGLVAISGGHLTALQAEILMATLDEAVACDVI